MEKNFKRTLVTTALPYANGPVHIGHLAGVYVPADIYTRYLRLKGEDVIMIGGSDEHGRRDEAADGSGGNSHLVCQEHRINALIQ